MDTSRFHDEVTPERLEALERAFPWPADRPSVSLTEAHLGCLDRGVRDLLAGELSADTRLVVELGAWLGLTTRFLADHARNATVVAIDHWLGSPEHHSRSKWQAMLPTLHETFLALCWPYRHRIVPLRLPTLIALQLLADYGLPPGLIYLGAGHSYQEILSELELSDRLFPRAILVGGDCSHSPVREAVTEFARRHGLTSRTAGNGWKLMREQEGGRS